MNSLHNVSVPLRAFQPQGNVYPFNDQRTVIGFDLASDIRGKLPGRSIDMTRIQRASKGSNHSTAGRSDHIVESRCVNFRQPGWIDAIVRGNRPVNAKLDGLGLGRDGGRSQRPLVSGKFYFGHIYNVAHRFNSTGNSRRIDAAGTAAGLTPADASGSAAAG